jgi:hypothetical protein
MRNGLVIGLALGLAVLASPSAYAFQEQKEGAAAPAEAQPQAAPEAPAEKPLGVTSETMPSKDETGTEIRIPGLGKLGVLPKMDFGLELLYGAAEQKPAGAPEAAPNPDDDLTIRGSVKHRF